MGRDTACQDDPEVWLSLSNITLVKDIETYFPFDCSHLTGSSGQAPAAASAPCAAAGRRSAAGCASLSSARVMRAPRSPGQSRGSDGGEAGLEIQWCWGEAGQHCATLLLCPGRRRAPSTQCLLPRGAGSTLGTTTPF